MTPRTMRKAERGVQLVWAVALVLYVYGFLPSWGESAVRWVVIPGIATSGFAMWFAAPLRKLGRRVRALSLPRSGARPARKLTATGDGDTGPSSRARALSVPPHRPTSQPDHGVRSAADPKARLAGDGR
jgi:hypothetical protein